MPKIKKYQNVRFCVFFPESNRCAIFVQGEKSVHKISEEKKLYYTNF
jgi:hypothetical protein